MTFVRDQILRGVREVDALLLEGPRSAEQVLSHWDAGATLLALGPDRFVVRLREPARLRCEHGRATPLVDRGGDRLVAFPLDAAGVSGLASGTLTSVRSGKVVTESGGIVADPVSLLDLSDWHRVPAIRSEPPAAGRGPVAPPPDAAPPVAFDARELGGDHTPTPRDRRQWDRLVRPSPRRLAPRRPAPSPGRAPGAGPTGSGPLDWLYRRRHQRYLSELTRLFAAGDYDEALRRAIPLGGADGPLARFRPRPRRFLELDPHRPPDSATVPIDPGLQAELQTRYRSAVARLEGDGRIKEAAFVLAELLNRVPEACSFLERHGEFRLAAELAESRSTDRAEAVRLWWRAGDRSRAVALARRHGCFAAAIGRLERSGRREEASALRRTWVGHLLDAGDLVAAYDVGAGLDDEADRRVRKRLIDIGVSQAGPLRARMLARHLRAGEDQPRPELADAIGDPLASRELEVVLEDVTRSTDRVDHPDAVRAIVRRLLAERRDVDRQQLRRAIDLAEDAVLRADLPPLERFTPDARDVATTWVDLDDSDRGQIEVRDARMLPDGRLVLVLPDVGVQVVRPTGKLDVEFDVPADEVIPSDNGLRLLAVRRLGEEAIAVAWIALPERKVVRLGEVPATRWASSYDGASWFLAHHDQLWMLDMLPEGPSALWRQEDTGGWIAAIARSPSQLVVASVAEVDPGDGSPLAAIRRIALPILQELDTLRRPFGRRSILQPSGEVVEAEAASELYRARIERVENDALVVVATKAGVEAPVAVVRLAGVSTARVRIEADALVVFDDLGRVEVVELTTGARRTFRTTV